MQLGFITLGDTEDVFFARKYDFDCLEVALFTDQPFKGDPAQFKRACNGEGVPVAAVSLFGQEFISPDAMVRGKAADRLKEAADLAAMLGAPVVVTGSGSAGEGMSRRAAWDRSLEVMEPLVKQVQSRGLTFAFYNCHWANEVNTPDAWDYVLPKLPGAGVKFDPSHPVYEGRDWMPDCLAAGPHMVHAHAKDVLRVGETRIPDPNPGLGQINWGAFFGLLYEAGYDAAVCIEPHSAVYTGERRYPGLVMSGRYLRQFMLPEL